MDLRLDMLTACDRYCLLTGKKRSTASTYAMKDGKFFDRIASGAGFHYQTYERVMRWFQENTPDEEQQGSSPVSSTPQEAA